MIKKPNKILSGAFFLGLGAFLSKLLGAIYRIPLTNLLGSTGLGLYQLVFPVYTVLLDFSGAGVPSALSRIISSADENDRQKSAHEYLGASLKLLALLGSVGTILMFVLSKPLSMLQGNVLAFKGYIFLAPSILAVSLISCFRGYFQGLMNMKPTAISQVVEQFVKLGVGLILVYLLMPNVSNAVAGATFAITVSEIVALLFLYITYKRKGSPYPLIVKQDRKALFFRIKKIVLVTLPITLVGIMLPLSQVIDSCLVINILNRYRRDATSLYGLLGGVVTTVIGLPVSICYGVATVAIPAISSAKAKRSQGKNAVRTILLTLLVAVPSAIACAVFAPTIIRILFSRLVGQEKVIAINLLRLSSVNVVLLSLIQTTNAIFIGKGRLYFPVISLGVGVIVKVMLNVVLLNKAQLNIYGGAIAVIACYFVVCLINLSVIFISLVKNANKRDCDSKFKNQE